MTGKTLLTIVLDLLVLFNMLTTATTIHIEFKSSNKFNSIKISSSSDMTL